MSEMENEPMTAQEYVAQDEETRRLYKINPKAHHDRVSMLADAWEEGYAEGTIEWVRERLGDKEGVELFIALILLEKDIHIKIISKYTGIPEDELQQLSLNKKRLVDSIKS